MILLMERILHQLVGRLSQYLYTGLYTSQVVQDFFHQQYFQVEPKVLKTERHTVHGYQARWAKIKARLHNDSDGVVLSDAQG